MSTLGVGAVPVALMPLAHLAPIAKVLEHVLQPLLPDQDFAGAAAGPQPFPRDPIGDRPGGDAGMLRALFLRPVDGGDSECGGFLGYQQVDQRDN